MARIKSITIKNIALLSSSLDDLSVHEIQDSSVDFKNGQSPWGLPIYRMRFSLRAAA